MISERPGHVLGDLKDPRLMYLKAVLFLIAGTASALALLLNSLSLQTAFLLAVAIWSFCRLYYFMFYVIEKYVDGQYRFAGIHSFVVYLIQKRRAVPKPAVEPPAPPPT